MFLRHFCWYLPNAFWYLSMRCLFTLLILSVKVENIPHVQFTVLLGTANIMSIKKILDADESGKSE